MARQGTVIPPRLVEGGSALGGKKKITATVEHLFWVPKKNAWINAADLKPGTTLSTPDGTTARIVRNDAYTDHVRTYNFTVANFHTYYVLAGETPILVHNTCDGKAAVRWDKDMEHATIRVEGNGVSLETEKVIHGWSGGGSPSGLPTTGAHAESLGQNVIERAFSVPDVQAAMRAQRASIGADLGGYDGIHNS